MAPYATWCEDPYRRRTLMVHVVVFLLSVEEDFFLTCSFRYSPARNKEAEVPGQVTNHISHQLSANRRFHHRCRMMTWGTELTVPAGLADLAEQIYGSIAAQLNESRLWTATKWHRPYLGMAFLSMQKCLDEWEYPFLHYASREVMDTQTI